MNRYDDDQEYGVAKRRIDDNPELEPHRETILYDWGEGGEHWNWIGYAEIHKIIRWAESVEKDQQDELYIQDIENGLRIDY